MYLSHADSFPFSLSHGARFRTAVKLIDAQPGQSILDYGCGNGRLLKLLPHGNLTGYDPVAQNLNGFRAVSSTLQLAPASFDTISLCEVLEHVSANERETILADCYRLLKPDGKLIVSVPIEVGLSALVKNLARWFKVRPLETDMTFGNVLRSTFYLPINRFDYGGFFGHMGFHYADLEKQIREKFRIERKTFSPLPFGPLFNSQVFYVLTKHLEQQTDYRKPQL